MSVRGKDCRDRGRHPGSPSGSLRALARVKRPTSPSAIRTWTEIRSTMLRVTCRKRFDVHDRQQAVDGPRLLMISPLRERLTRDP